MFALFLCTCAAAGCTAARKPAPSPTETAPAPTDNTNMTTTDKQKAERITQKATQVKGVRKAVAVVSDKSAFIGLDLESVEGEADKSVKDEVAKQVKAAESSLETVNVTSDPDLVTRLRNIADGIDEGKPVTTFSEELAEIGRKIKVEMR